jgi:hypothetical protein
MHHSSIKKGRPINILLTETAFGFSLGTSGAR